MKSSLPILAACVIAAGACTGLRGPAEAPPADADAVRLESADAPPPGVEQLLPRGQIAAIFEPRFVSAADAEIDDDAWVLGVVLDGQARAYSLNLLNEHEVVNDAIGERSFAAVW